MSFLDKVGNRVDKMKSKQSENSDINSFNKQIKAENDAIDILINEIGEYYWNLYATDDSFTPPEDLADVFESIADHVSTKNELESKIEDRKIEGVNQRIEIDKNTQAIEEKKAAVAAERKRQKEEAKKQAEQAKLAEKAAEEVTSDDDQ